MSAFSPGDLDRVDARIQEWAERHLAASRARLLAAGRAISSETSKKNAARTGGKVQVGPSVRQEDGGDVVRLQVKWRTARTWTRRLVARNLRRSAKAVWSTWWR